MTTKLIVKLGFKLATVYTIIISGFTIVTEGAVILTDYLLKTVKDSTPVLKIVFMPHLLIIILGLLILVYMEYISRQEAESVSFLDSLLMSQSKPIFNALLGILVIVKGITLLIIAINNAVYYVPNVSVMSIETYNIHIAMFRADIIRSVFSMIKILIGIGISLGFKGMKKKKIEG